MKGLSGFIIILSVFFATATAGGDGATRLSGHLPLKRMAKARELGRKASSSNVQLAIVLNSSDPVGLASTLQGLYDPGSPLYHQFLTPEQFASRFGASTQDIENVSQYLTARGLNITKTHSNQLVIDAEGSTSTIENAFQVELHDYLSDDGRVVFAPTADPAVSDEIAPILSGIAGLNNFSLRKPRYLKNSLNSEVQPDLVINNYMTPSRIKSVYGLSSLSQTGSGETIGLFELDGYTSSDITAYESNFSLRAPTLSNVLVDGASGIPTTGDDSGAPEVTLDIELAVAMAPGVSKILVYEAPNSQSGLVDTYSRMATDNLANEISSSWGEPEDQMSTNDFTTEATIFQEMAAQGQTIFAASGDDGAYGDSVDGNNSQLIVQDPSSQPYVTGVGGTTLTWSGSTWASETSWVASAATGTYGQNNYNEAEGGGGGISSEWSIPSWQSGLSTVANKGSSSMRMVPDVSLDADPNSGYPIYYSGSWSLYGGTSCASPLWAAFIALVNQQRVTNGLSRIGFANPAIYQIGNASVSTNFHDIADNSTNLYYPAKTGYDLTTGWGTINGSTLFNSLVAFVLAPVAPTLTLTPGSLSITASWSADAGASTYNLYRSTTNGGTYTEIASALSTTSYTDSTVSYGTTYYYYLQAVNTAGTSPNSTIQSSTPYPAVPGAPTSLSASAIE